MTLNCGEFKKCGRQPGGAHVSELGPCPAATFSAANGFLGGRNAGRACAYVTGTFCSGTIEGTYREKAKTCDNCDFYMKVHREEGARCSVASFLTFIRERDQQAHDKFKAENAGLPGLPKWR